MGSTVATTNDVLPVTGMSEIVSGWPPGLLTVIVWETVAPGPIAPKSKLGGVTAIWGGGGVMPVPLTATFVGEFKALLGNVMVLETVPADCGANDIPTVTEPPAAIV